MNIRIDLEEIEALDKRISEINAVALDTIDFYRNGVKLDIAPDLYKSWSFIGMCNFDFISTEYYTNPSVVQVHD